MGFNLKKILRALLFSTSDPLTIKDIQAVVTRYHSELENAKKALAKNAEQNDSIIQMPPDPQLDEPRGENSVEQTEIEDIMSQVPTLLTATQIREAMEEIAGELEENGDVCRLLQSSSGFKLAISKDYADWVRLLRNDPRPQKLTRAALETLAIIAYRQPVTRAEIEAIRGVNADSAITRLTEKELIFISGRADLPGRPVQFSTTSNLLDFIGVNSIEELPASDVLSPNQISEWIRRASSPQEIKEKDVGLPDNDAEHNTREVVIDSENANQKELDISVDVEPIDAQQDYVDEPIADSTDSSEEL
jgi:segregation and condensation protein B